MMETSQTDAGRGPAESAVNDTPPEQEVFLFPLSFAQKRLWFLQQLEPDNPAYHVAGMLSLSGPLDVGVLWRSLVQVVDRHEVLRTTFSTFEGAPVQVVSQQTELALPVVAIDRLSPAERTFELERLAAADARRPFDLIRGPLLRLVLFRLADGEHALGYTMHHLVTDGWSESVLMREVAVCYQAFADRRQPPLPELPIQYGDFSQWQQEVLEGETLEGLSAFWKERLAGAPRVLELPTDRPRPTTFSYRGATVPFGVAEEVMAALRAVGQERGATPFVVLLTAFGILLGRDAGQRRVLIGSPVANRQQIELENLIGLFLDTVVLEVDLTGDPTFEELLERAREMTHQALEHQEMPFEALVTELAPERDPSRNPIFQVWFNHQSRSTAGAELTTELAVGLWPVSTRTVKFDLMLDLLETENGLDGGLTYCADLWSATTIRRTLVRFIDLLTAITIDPRRRISELPLIGRVERHQMLAEWNAPPRPALPADVDSLPSWFDAVAERSADAVAMLDGERAWSFRKLRRWSVRWARQLRRHGIGPDAAVGLALDPSPQVLAAILAVLRAGGAYVPLDPSLPAERLAYQASNAGLKLLLTARRHARSLDGTGVEVLDLEALDLEAPDLSAGRTGATPGAGTVHGDNLAYVLYTSGSTGRPKGVMVSHRGLANYLGWCLAAYHPERGRGAPVHTSLAFDLTLTSLFAPLLAGRPVRWVAADGEIAPLRETLEQVHGFSLVKLTPIHLQLLSHPSPPANATPTWILGGEALAAEPLEPWRRSSPEARLINEYGPTETVVGCCVYEVTSGDPASGAVPIGRPLTHTELFVLDPRMRPAPCGVVGELYVGGRQLARGYVRRPAMTAAPFVPHPWSGRPGRRLYATGDLVRYRGDGVLEFLGRADHQLKVRGFRVEPGEIETVLREHPDVREAVVMAHDQGGEQRLFAYLAVEDLAAAPAADELRAVLGRRLPAYMLPAVFVTVEALPLTPHGKIDRRALLALEATPESRRELPYVPPRTTVEETLASLWASVLGVDRVGVDDNFFNLGGDSIRSIELTSRASEYGWRLSVRQIAQYPTIAELARRIASGEGEAPDDVHTEPFGLLSPEDRTRLPEGLDDAYPLARMQLGMLYHQEQIRDRPVFHSVNSYYLRMPFDAGAFQRAMTRVTARHANLRTSFDLTSYSEPLQLVVQAADFPIWVVDLRRLPASRQEEILEDFWKQEERRPFDLARSPQLRFHMHLRSDDTVQYTLTENHAVIDGWSLHTVYNELLTCYFALLEGHGDVELPPIRTTFRDFVHLERQALASEEARQFWTDQLADCTVLRLPPRPKPRAVRPGSRCRRIDLRLEASQFEALQRLARSEAVPLKSVFLAAHLRVLSVLGGQSDVLTGLSSNGRLETPDGHRVSGLFLNTLPFRLRLTVGTWRELVRQVHRAEVRILPYRRYPLADIQSRWGREALFDTSFVYLNFHVLEDAVRSRKLEVLDSGAFVEETNFAIMTAFYHPIGSGELTFNLTCDLEVLSESQIAAVRDYYLSTLAAMASQPDGRYERTSPLSAAERHLLLTEANGAPAASAAGETVRDGFRAAAERIPDRPALVFEDSVLSYRELDRRSRRLAGRLRAANVRPESRVVIALEHSTDFVIALLAVLEAGAAYVPLDPSEPDERLRHLVRDSGASVALTRGPASDALTAGGAAVMRLDGGSSESPAAPADLPAVAVDPRSLAYVIYTSGSTGRPKGVAIEHRQLAAYVEGVVRQLDLPTEGDYAMVSPFTVDLGYTMLFPALARGGTLHVLPRERTTDAAAFAETFRRRAIDCLKIVPSHLAALLEHPQPALPRRRLILGGEAASESLLETLAALISGPPEAPKPRVCNHYGPTETTVGVLAGTLGQLRPPLPLGRPLSGVRGLVLDEYLELTPPRVVGELWIGGPTLARGYRGQPARTAEHFLPDPWAEETGQRLYRTGDRVRLRSDGETIFLGRSDHQVKIRGFRVELGEIEAALHGHPAVREAAVTLSLAEDSGTGDAPARLSAFVVSYDGAPEGSELRAFLAERLPAALVPATFQVVRELPRTALGKLDRSALGRLARTGQEPATAEFVAPRGALESRLAEILGEILGVERLGAGDSFFEAGGDSIRAILAVARIRKAFGVEVAMETLLESPTVASLAAHIEDLRQGLALSIRRVPRRGVLPLSFSQKRLWYLQLLDPSSAAYNMPHGLRFVGDLHVPALKTSLREVMRRHEVLRTSFPAENGEPRVAIADAPDVVFPQVDLRRLADGPRQRELERLAAAEAWRPFDVSRGPLVRALLLRLADDDHGALLTLHHLVFDGWSIGILSRELAALYEAFRRGRPSPLPELPFQYVDYAHWQRQLLRGERLASHLDYWRRQLATAPALELAGDRPRSSTVSYRGASLSRRLPAGASGGIRELSRRQGATIFMTLLTAWTVLLHHHSDQEDVVVGSPVAGDRGREELGRLVGLFLNTVPFRTNLRGNPSFRELIDRVRQVALEAYRHQEVPFEKVVAELRSELGTDQLFRAWFNHSNAPNEGLELEGLSLAPLTIRATTVKYDLMLSTAEEADGLRLWLGYSLDLFDRGTADALLAELGVLLSTVAESPDLPLATLRDVLAAAGEKRREERRRERRQARRSSLKAARRRTMTEDPIPPTPPKPTTRETVT